MSKIFAKNNKYKVINAIMASVFCLSFVTPKKMSAKLLKALQLYFSVKLCIDDNYYIKQCGDNILSLKSMTAQRSIDLTYRNSLCLMELKLVDLYESTSIPR